MPPLEITPCIIHDGCNCCRSNEREVYARTAASRGLGSEFTEGGRFGSYFADEGNSVVLVEKLGAVGGRQVSWCVM